MNIELADYDLDWPGVFDRLAVELSRALGASCLRLEHIGSTAIPGIKAKPIIDVLGVVDSFALVDVGALQEIKFMARGELVPTGRYFSKIEPKAHLHLFELGNPRIEEYVAFRDWMRTHPEDRDLYEELKLELASIHADGMDYARAKTAFISRILAKCRR